MKPAFVLVHSPSVGPSTWSPVAERLTALGHECHVPSLLSVADAPAPHWRRVVELVGATLDGLAPEQPVVLVVHSNAGLFVPQLVTTAVRPVVAGVFVDAALPVLAGETPVVPPGLLESLRDMAVDGRLPPWTDWFAESDVAPMFPDPATRARISGEQPRLPIEYYLRPVPAPSGWDSVPCGYVLFGPPYDEVAARAHERGWPVEEAPGKHLHMIVDPDGVADRILALTSRLTSGPAATPSIPPTAPR